MTIELNYFITKPECKEATFEIYLEHYHLIKSITLKNISFYNSWWSGDFIPEGVKVFHFLITDRGYEKSEILNAFDTCSRTMNVMRNPNESFEEYAERFQRESDLCIDNLKLKYNFKDKFVVKKIFDYDFPFHQHFSLSEFCNRWQFIIEDRDIKHVKLYCDNYNYIIIELTENKEFKLKELFTTRPADETETGPDEEGREIKISRDNRVVEYLIKIVNKWFGFKQEKFDEKGKYYSTRPLPFYVTNLFLRCDLHQNTLQNNQNSNILCSIPVKDGEQIKLQRFIPGYTRRVDKATNHLTFQITDKNGKVVNFRGCKLMFHFTLETEPIVIQE